MTPDRITLGDYLANRWLPAQRARLRPSTFDSYSRVIATHVVPRLGAVKLQKLRADHLDKFYVDLLTEGRVRGDSKKGTAGLSPTTVRYAARILSKALADAERKGTISRNPAPLSDPPKPDQSHRAEIKAWTATELRTFLDGVSAHRLHPMLYLAANTGLRRGELVGLEWSAVDLDASRLTVRTATVSVAYAKQTGSPKTSTGERVVDLDARTVAVLKAWKRTQAAERLAVGPDYDRTLVFTRPEGTGWHPVSISKSFDRLVKRSALVRIRLHDLRHTHASLLLAAGTPVKVVSERLGHASPALTMAQYQHVLPGMQAEAANAFGDLLFGTR